MTTCNTKSEDAFDEWYIPLKEDPMPHEVWDAAIKWVQKFLKRHAVKPDGRTTQFEPFVMMSRIEEMTK